MPKRSLLTLVLALTACFCLAPVAQAAPSLKKSIWGPADEFPTYADLGAGLYQTPLFWNDVAPRRPEDPTNPNDSAYNWPKTLDLAVDEAPKYGMEVSVLIIFSPPWANGGRPYNWAPNPQQFANFAAAASKRYPTVRHWMIWGEPGRKANFNPMTAERRSRWRRPRRLSSRQARAPRLYARILDAAYGSLKAVNPRNLVIGGNTNSTGDIGPFNWMRYLRLPGGRRPRMDLYGHNPYPLARRPNLRTRPYRGGRYGFADFSDLDTFARWLNRYQGRRLRIFISEFYVPTDHANAEFNFWVSRRTQASWLRAALRITRRSRRIYTMGWYSLRDDPHPASGHGLEMHRGLIDHRGRRKPSYYVFRKG